MLEMEKMRSSWFWLIMSEMVKVEEVQCNDDENVHYTESLSLLLVKVELSSIKIQKDGSGGSRVLSLVRLEALFEPQ